MSNLIGDDTADDAGAAVLTDCRVERVVQDPTTRRVVGVVARMGEKETVRLIAAGASDMMGPALVVLLAGGVSVLMTNTQTLDTILNSMEGVVHGQSSIIFVVLLAIVAVVMPAVFQLVDGNGLPAPSAEFVNFGSDVETLSLITALVLMGAYVGGLIAVGVIVATPIVAWAMRTADKLTVEPDTGEYND